MCPPIQIGTFSDIGWVVSHSYTLYGPLLAGAATVLYEGKPVGTPDASAFWRIVEEYKVKTMLYVWDFPCQCFSSCYGCYSECGINSRARGELQNLPARDSANNH